MKISQKSHLMKFSEILTVRTKEHKYDYQTFLH